METGAQNLNMLMKSSLANNNYFRSIIVNSVRFKRSSLWLFKNFGVKKMCSVWGD